MRAQPEASHYIHGQFVEDESGPVIESRYPANGEVIARLHGAGQERVNEAVASAREGFKIWSSTPAVERGRILRKAADIMREHNYDLSELETLDTGKPLQETLVADAASGADCLEYFGTVVGSLTGDHVDLGPAFGYTRREPLGVCVGIGAWNYPIQIASWKSAPALACGNSMIFKPSEITPLSALRLAEIYKDAGLPDGVFNVVQGYGETGGHLISHPDIAKVSLTGSVATGAKVAELAGQNLKHVTLELGGKSPIIVFEDADIDNAISGAMLGNFYSSGQICSNGTRVFVHNAVRDQFLERLAERTSRIVIGDPLDEETQMGPLVSKTQFDKVLNYMVLGQSEGARLVCGGKVAKPDGIRDGYFVEPTVFADVQDHMRIAQEEIFGPVMCVLDFDSEEEAITRANGTQFGLAAGVFTKDIQRAHRVINALHAGTCWINTYNLTPIELPFGGYKKSGIGRENGHAALDHYSQIKSVYVEMGDVDSPY